MEVRGEKGQAVVTWGLLLAFLGLVLLGLVFDGGFLARYYLKLRNAAALAAQTAAGQSLDVPHYMETGGRELFLDGQEAMEIAFAQYRLNTAGASNMHLRRLVVNTRERWVEVELEGTYNPMFFSALGPITLRVKARAYGAHGIQQEGQ